MAQPTPHRVLLVDDEPTLLRAYELLLVRSGFHVETASNGKEAIAKVAETAYGTIVSDVSMPEMDGLEFLRAVRGHDLDVPVILMTGAPGVESAMRAVEYGAFRYLTKPVDRALLESTVRRALQALDLFGGDGKRLGDRASLEARFTMGLKLLWMAYQPIVSLRERRVFGYEALLRSAEPTLPNPGEILDVAERLGRVHDLGRAIRRRVASEISLAPGDAHLFVNLHSIDLGDDDLYDPGSALSGVASRVVLEITERASLDGVQHVESRVQRLRARGFRVAIDDLGAGYAGLTSFTQLEPDIAKLDMSLVRDIDKQPRKQSIVRSMTRLCDELGIQVVVEGVETPAERDQLAELGCDLMQGYLFARPDRGYRSPSW
jgi:EAL domain-containing protein (putative c-di-GMP-specific phosphodiesterase class I)